MLPLRPIIHSYNCKTQSKYHIYLQSSYKLMSIILFSNEYIGLYMNYKLNATDSNTKLKERVQIKTYKTIHKK